MKTSTTTLLNSRNLYNPTLKRTLSPYYKLPGPRLSIHEVLNTEGFKSTTSGLGVTLLETSTRKSSINLNLLSASTLGVLL